MNPFSDSFLNYEDTPLNFDNLRETDFSLTSPNSDSTGFHGNSVSPPEQQYFMPQDQFQSDCCYYGDEYNFSSDYQTKLSIF